MPNSSAHSARLGVLVVGNHLSERTTSRTVSEDLAVRLRDAGFTVRCTSSKASPAIRLFDMLRTTLQRRNEYDVALIDVFSGRAFHFAEAVSWLLKRSGHPQILFLHGGDLPALAHKSPQRVRRLFGNATALISPSPFLAERLAEFGDVRILPNPIDCSRFLAPPSTRVRNKVLWLRAFHNIYRPWDAISVVARARNSCPEMTLKMVGPDKGDGALARVLESVEKQKAEDFVQILSEGVHYSQVPETLAEADLFLNTTAVDNTPISVLEALASGLPVVSTNAGGIPNLLKHGETGLLSDVGAIEDLAANLCSLANDPELYSRQQRNGFEFARTRDWSEVLPLWSELITGLAHERRAGQRRG